MVGCHGIGPYTGGCLTALALCAGGFSLLLKPLFQWICSLSTLSPLCFKNRTKLLTHTACHNQMADGVRFVDNLNLNEG